MASTLKPRESSDLARLHRDTTILFRQTRMMMQPEPTLLKAKPVQKSPIAPLEIPTFNSILMNLR